MKQENPTKTVKLLLCKELLRVAKNSEEGYTGNYKTTKTVKLRKLPKLQNCKTGNVYMDAKSSFLVFVVFSFCGIPQFHSFTVWAVF